MTAVAGTASHTYVPRGAARTLFESRDGEVLMCGPAGTGKSRAALEKGLMLALANPGSAGLIVRKTHVSLTSTGLVTWNKWVIPEAKAAGVVSYFGGSGDRPPTYEFTNGSTIAIGGMDKPDKIMSSEYDWCFVQEATELTLEDWEAITTRLRNGVISFQQLMADCNPSTPYHWLNQRCEVGDTKMIYSRHEDNPRYYDDLGRITKAGADYIEGKLSKLTGVRRTRLYEGKWAAAEGLVYEAFDPAVHIVDGLPEGSENWDRIISVDFGYRDPFVAQWWARDHDGAMWLYREIFMTGRLVEDHAAQILSAMRRHRPGTTGSRDRDYDWHEPIPRAIVCDTADREGRETLTRHINRSTVGADKGIKTGIDAVMARFRIDEKTGKPRIYFVRNALIERDKTLVDAGLPSSTIEELSGYVWPNGVKSAHREVPVDENNHGMDAMRYAVMEIDFARPPKIRLV